MNCTSLHTEIKMIQPGFLVPRNNIASLLKSKYFFPGCSMLNIFSDSLRKDVRGLRSGACWDFNPQMYDKSLEDNVVCM